MGSHLNSQMAEEKNKLPSFNVWEKTEIDELEKMYYDGYPLGVMSDVIGRTKRAIIDRLHYMDLRLRKRHPNEVGCPHKGHGSYTRYLGVGYTTGGDYYKCDKCGYIFKVNGGE